jgi:hypothetical protein
MRETTVKAKTYGGTVACGILERRRTIFPKVTAITEIFTT